MQCVLLAAGMGKRMWPLTATRPKVMIPVANRPMLAHLIGAAVSAGFDDIVCVVGYREEAVRNYFGKGERCGAPISYVVQRSQRGTGDALLSARHLLEDDFVLLNGDMLLSSDDLQKVSRAGGACMGIAEVEHPEEYGVVEVDSGYITGLYEKTRNPPTNLINAGAYHLDSRIFDYLRSCPVSERGEVELTDGLQEYISKGELQGIVLSSWMDVGFPWNILDANALCLEHLEPEIAGTVEENVTFHGAVVVKEGAVIKSGTYIEGPCIIGENCRIGPHAYLRGSTAIGANCHIGHSVEVKNSVIFPNTNIPHFNYVGDSIIGSGCNLGAGTKVANLRHDNRSVMVGMQDTMRRKFGAVVGDDVLFGINCSVNVGAAIGRGARIGPHSYVRGIVGEDTVIR